MSFEPSIERRHGLIAASRRYGDPERNPRRMRSVGAQRSPGALDDTAPRRRAPRSRSLEARHGDLRSEGALPFGDSGAASAPQKAVIVSMARGERTAGSVSL